MGLSCLFIKLLAYNFGMETNHTLTLILGAIAPVAYQFLNFAIAFTSTTTNKRSPQLSLKKRSPLQIR